MNIGIVLGDGGHHCMVNNNGCQEFHLSPPVWITSTNRHAHCWKGQRIGLDVGKVKESSGCVHWLRLFKQGGISGILGSHCCSRYRGDHRRQVRSEKNSQLEKHGFGSLHNLCEHVILMRIFYIDIDFASQMKLTKFPLIHCFNPEVGASGIVFL